ncbi:MAG: rhomboid family intramembrane serine protease [Microscillaceae bacterium]|nr:rhomboid family intramembrane serine protease [Microscillaceae bacterium]
MRITYNAPVILTYTLICVVITGLDSSIFANAEGHTGTLSQMLFMVYPFGFPEMNLNNPLAYFRLFSHAMGHANWAHLVGNFSFILLLGPILEEKYGSRLILLLLFMTAFITGILNAALFDNSLLGASGEVFMMILLVSFTNARRGTIPLTFILVALLFLGKEIYGAMAAQDQISQFAHIIGGVCGGVFGYLISPKTNPVGSSPKTQTSPGSGLDLTDLTDAV